MLSTRRGVCWPPIWRGQVRMSIISPPAERWDEVIVVAYPARGAFSVAESGSQRRGQLVIGPTGVGEFSTTEEPGGDKLRTD
jgi:hypothetical protein